MDSRGSEGSGSGSLVPVDHLFPCMQNRQPEFSPLYLHTHEVNMQGDDMYMAASL